MSVDLSQAVVTITGHELTIEEVIRVARHGARVALGDSVPQQLGRSRRMVEKALAEQRPIYGLTTGVGELRNVFIPPEQVRELQKNIVRSHAAGAGPPLEREVVRAMLLARANCLAMGYSGVRLEVVQRLVDMLNLELHPVIPSQGSLGASGDLAPLAHLALTLTGEGKVEFLGSVMAAQEALAQTDLRPIALEAKEGLALINGTQMMSGILALAVDDAETLARTADVAAALSIEALAALDAPFADAVHRVRPHPGQRIVARNVRELIAGSEIVAAARTPDHVQDAYSIRCIPQVHGATRDTIAFVRQIVERELNSATDNPLLFPSGDGDGAGDVISAGNFHGQPLALAADYLGIALAELANISERRIERLVNPHLSGLPAFLTGEAGLTSGYMVAHYTAASLVSENKVLAHPASVDSIPTSAGQEDHVSMGAIAARKARRILRHAEQVIGVELICAAQGIEFRRPLKPGHGTAAVYEAVRRRLAPLDRSDRIIHDDLAVGLELTRSGEAVGAAAEVTRIE